MWWSVPPSRSSPSAGSASPPGGRRAAALHAVGVVRAGRGEREKTGAPLTAPPGLGVPRPPPLPRRGPSPAGWDGGWGGEAWRGCESGGRRRAAPPSPFPGGTSGAGGLVARACRGRHLRVRTCPFPLVPVAGRGEGRGGDVTARGVHAGPLRSSLSHCRGQGRPGGLAPLCLWAERGRSTSRPGSTRAPGQRSGGSTSRPDFVWLSPSGLLDGVES